ncbi:tetratricopeptide repeat protein [Thiorhodococcus minor]|uniref:Tetratricopeptide repeat protein n=1 Tax=Thiorhodococcus minor TaxID=57489 RepID=A0A6M0K3Y2_9GAMM|nr:hypothetical protein [Thiorhodococcus minor]NEV63961.1 hypothetical protein [Thiorhodococcus minor]
MSKKQKRRAASRSRKPSQLPPETLAEQARQHLDANRFRDAIADFKQLLKQEPRPEWRDGLADAYAGRANELAAKGMHKEAMVMWDNRAALGADVPPSVDHLMMLIRTGRLESALDQLAESSKMAKADQDRLRSAIAAQTLAQGADIADRLPAEDPIRRQAPAASAALDAYCAGNDPALREALSGIPFRSPYRDLAQILKALQMLPDSPKEATRALERVADDSGFAPLKQAAELALLPESAFLKEALRAHGNRMRMACMLRGWPDARIALLGELSQLGDHAKPDALLAFIHKRGSQLGEGWAIRKTLRLLLPNFPNSIQRFKALGPPGLSDLEEILIDCWYFEEIEDLHSTAHGWSGLAGELIYRAKEGSATQEDRLRIALALRRADRFSDILSASPDEDHVPPHVQQMILSEVEQSLDWDPEDRDTYLRLIDFYRARGRAKDARRILAAASERWPEDMRVLQASMETAIDSGAFKKASTIARRILEIDPINTEVRDALVDAHLAHARKQMLKNRSDLAAKELDAAREWARSTHASEQLDITAGLNRLDNDLEAGLSELGRVAERLGNGLDAQVAMVLAADAVRRIPSSLLKSLKLRQITRPDADDLLAALARLRRFLDRGGKPSERVKDTLSKPLAKAVWGQLQRQDAESACETLRRAGLDDVRQKAAKAALKQWRGAPIFEMHAFEAKYPHGCYDGFNHEVLRLESALDRARQEGDTRTAIRIQNVLDRSFGPFGRGPSPFQFSPDDFEPEPLMDESPLDPFIEMIEEVGLEQAMEAIQMPKPLRKDLRKVAREQGEGALIDLLDILSEGLLAGGLPGGPPPPRNPPPKGGKPKPASKSDDKPDDEDPPTQLDLFS